MRLFTFYYPVWIVVAAAIFAVGYAVATGTNKKVFMTSGIVAAVATLLLGVFCVYFMPTDEKAVRKTINETKDAVVAGDLEGTLAHISDDATKARALARMYVGKVKFRGAKITNFKVLEVNRLASPPRARVSFRASASGTYESEFGAASFATLVDFNVVEMRLGTDEEWRLTDNLDFSEASGF